MIDQCRTPRWVRGLKLNVGNPNVLAMASHPTMGAWIEIILHAKNLCDTWQSHPTMGAWIEIVHVSPDGIEVFVAPHDGCVD